mgnify:FL=1
MRHLIEPKRTHIFNLDEDGKYRCRYCEQEV